MSRLSEILGVKEGQEFIFESEPNIKSKIKGNKRLTKVVNRDRWEEIYSESLLIDMIAHPELIHPIPEKPQLTEQQITAIKGRIAEGTPWAARDKDKKHIGFYDKKPYLNEDETYYVNDESDYSCSISNNFYDFITFENSPVYLPELVEESEK